MPNEILSEIHRVREEIARECGYDVKEIFWRMRAQTELLKAQGWQVVSPVPREKETSYVLRVAHDVKSRFDAKTSHHRISPDTD